jgi:hypothetical protein
MVCKDRQQEPLAITAPTRKQGFRASYDRKVLNLKFSSSTSAGSSVVKIPACVWSKAELTIDDSLYLWGIPHAYEKKLPNTEHNVYSDFHIPSGKGRPKAVYIEYWGMENDEDYNARKTKKIEIYNNLGLTLIQLNDADIKNIEDSLQKYLLQHSIKVSLD